MNVTEGLHVIVEDRERFPGLTSLVTAVGPFVVAARGAFGTVVVRREGISAIE
jgi:hypothetical protein